MELKELFEKLNNSTLDEIHFDFANNDLVGHFWFNEKEIIIKFNKLVDFEYRPDFSEKPPWVILEANYKFIELDTLLLNHKVLFIGDSIVYNELNFPIIVSEFKSADVEIKIISESIYIKQA